MFTQTQVRHRPSEISPQVGQIFFHNSPLHGGPIKGQDLIHGVHFQISCPVMPWFARFGALKNL